ncbi:hypothetical protein BaRGS_00037658, partial [Batillaria attramentaria]
MPVREMQINMEWNWQQNLETASLRLLRVVPQIIVPSTDSVRISADKVKKLYLPDQKPDSVCFPLHVFSLHVFPLHVFPLHVFRRFLFT